MAYQGTYSIHPSQNHTAFPANVDDVDLTEADVVQSKPLSVHTVGIVYFCLLHLIWNILQEMSSFLYRLRLVELRRQVVDEVNCSGGYGLEFALQMETKITDVLGDIESHFQATNDTPKQTGRSSDAMFIEKDLCQIMGQAWLLRLHRPFLVQGYRDTRYVGSSEIRVNPTFKHSNLGTLPGSVRQGCSTDPPISVHKLSSQRTTPLAARSVI